MASDILTDQIETFNNTLRTEHTHTEDLFNEATSLYNSRCSAPHDLCPQRMVYSKSATCKDNSDNEKVTFKDVVIIGNGPSGISLSFILSGNRPYVNYDSLKTHSNKYLQYRLDAVRNPEDQYIPLLEQDLEQLSNGLEGRSKNSVSLLYDALAQPDADIGGLRNNREDILSWRYTDQHIDHVVLGKTEVGGAWQSMDQMQMKTVSIGKWMQLPGYPFQQWFLNNKHLLVGKQTYILCTIIRFYRQFPLSSSSLISRPLSNRVEDTASLRVNMIDVRNYYMDYVYKSKISNFSQNFRIRTEVNSVTKLYNDNKYKWKVCGTETTQNGEIIPFCYHCKSIVVATGVFDQSNRLNVIGENLNYVHHSIKEIDDLLTMEKLDRNLPLLVIGGGLSAADSILLARRYSLKIVHVIRRSVQDLPMKNLPSYEYPEYSHVYDLITSSDIDGYYTCYSEHEVIQFSQNNQVVIRSLEDGEEKVIKVCAALVLIGYNSKLDFLPSDIIDESDNRIIINPGTYESQKSEDIFAMGSLIGDNFVRFACGGALAIASSISKKYANNNR